MDRATCLKLAGEAGYTKEMLATAQAHSCLVRLCDLVAAHERERITKLLHRRNAELTEIDLDPDRSKNVCGIFTGPKPPGSCYWWTARNAENMHMVALINGLPTQFTSGARAAPGKDDAAREQMYGAGSENYKGTP